MVCKKCGKLINDDENYCSDCAPKESPVDEAVIDTPVTEPEVDSEPIADNEPVADTEPVEEPADTTEEQEEIKRVTKVVDGYGYAILSVILGVVSYFFAYVAHMLLADDGVFSSLVDGALASIIIFIIALILSVCCGIPSIIMCVRSIKTYISAVANDQLKTAPAVLLGIYEAIMTLLAIFTVVAALVIFVVLIF